MDEVSKLIPRPLSLVVNVNFYSCLPTIINSALSDGTRPKGIRPPP